MAMAAPMACCIHIVDDEKGDILLASDKSREKVIVCKDKWTLNQQKLKTRPHLSVTIKRL